MFYIGILCVYLGRYRNQISHTLLWMFHCVESVQIQSYFWSLFSCIRTECGDLLSNLRIQCEYRKIRARINSVFGHFSRSVYVLVTSPDSRTELMVMKFQKKVFALSCLWCRLIAVAKTYACCRHRRAYFVKGRKVQSKI